jgi:hypothetical protein
MRAHPLNSPAYYRDNAKQLREWALVAPTPEMGAQLTALAEQYEKLAKRAEARERGAKERGRKYPPSASD